MKLFLLLFLFTINAHAYTAISISTPIGSYITLTENDCSTTPSVIYCQYAPLYFDSSITAVPTGTSALEVDIFESNQQFYFTNCNEQSPGAYVCQAPDLIFSDNFDYFEN
jgi:hypothetical protein